MTQTNEHDTTRSRFERIEALTLEMAAANLRHDRSLERLNQASLRHDEEYQEIRATLSQVSERLNQVSERLNEVSEQQRVNQEQVVQLNVASLRHAEEMSQINATLREVSEQQRTNQHQIALNQEQLNQFTAGLVELRNLVANYIQSRSTLQSEE